MNPTVLSHKVQKDFIGPRAMKAHPKEEISLPAQMFLRICQLRRCQWYQPRGHKNKLELGRTVGSDWGRGEATEVGRHRPQACNSRCQGRGHVTRRAGLEQRRGSRQEASQGGGSLDQDSLTDKGKHRPICVH